MLFLLGAILLLLDLAGGFLFFVIAILGLTICKLLKSLRLACLQHGIPDRSLCHHAHLLKCLTNLASSSQSISIKCLRQHQIVKTGEDEQVIVLLLVRLLDYMLHYSSLLVSEAQSLTYLLQPEQALQDGVVVVLVLSYLDRLDQTEQ